MFVRLATAVLLLFLTCARAVFADAQSGDASIVHDAAARTWIVSAGGATLVVGLDASRDYQLLSLTSANGQNWLTSPVAGSTLSVNGTAVAFGSRGAGFELETAAATPQPDGTLRLDASFLHKASRLRVTRHIAVASGSPTFEMWTTFEPTAGAAAVVSSMTSIEMPIVPGTIRTLTGLNGDSADNAVTDAFTLREQALANGASLVIGAPGRAAAQWVPWFEVDGATSELYSALMWSGGWSLSIARTAAAMNVSLGVASMSTTIDSTVDAPHVLVGVTPGGQDQAAAGLRSYVLGGIRAGRPLSPLVTYNTWFAYGTEIDEASMRDEMTHAAALGAELFVIDAGWYTGAGASGPMDFDSGLGTWEPDPARFPNGLKPLTDYAHSLGMKFGIWVEPERVNLSTIGAPGAEEAWLATTDGDYGSDHAAQVCLASAAARQWVLDRLTTLLDAVQPDYLKWDNNFWINCNRDGHGHGATDGNFRHVNALYSILDTLRQQYPNLLIENVSGGGNRLDYGMLRYSDVAWMDDRTAPSIHVRHNIEGLSAAFPPGYLLSFLTDHDGEPLHESPDLPLYVRSRMAGALGLCFRSSELNDDDQANLANEIAIYTGLRTTLSVAAGGLLTAQAVQTDSAAAPPWDVLQAASPDAGAVVVYAYQVDTSADTMNVKPNGLDPSATYSVQSVDAGDLGTATGADLMASGIDVVQSPSTAAHILILAKQ